MLNLIPATLQDLDKIISLSKEAYLPYLEFLSRKPRVLRMTKTDWKNFITNKQVYIHKENDEIIAVVTFKIRKKDEYDLSRLAVSPKHQNKGIGTAIIYWAEKKAKEQSKNMNLAAYGKNKRLCEFYKKKGYTIVKRFVHKEEEIVIFKKKIV